MALHIKNYKSLEWNGNNKPWFEMMMLFIYMYKQLNHAIKDTVCITTKNKKLSTGVETKAHDLYSI
jgi:hypothetical protein